MESRILKNRFLSVTVLPERGGKLASLQYVPTGTELLAQPPCGFPALRPGMPFEEGDASGFDDVFPSMGEKACMGRWEEVPDHGMVWTMPMQCCGEGKNLSLQFCAEGWDYRKTVRLDGRSLILSWTIRNVSDRAMPYTWVCHCLWQLDDDMRFFYPDADMVDVMDPEEKKCDAVLQPTRDGSMAKTYTAGRIHEGRCGCMWPRRTLKMTMEWDAEKLPYLGFWITNGGWRGDRNFAFEPCLSFYDSLARSDASGTLRVMRAGEAAEFEIRIRIEEI